MSGVTCLLGLVGFSLICFGLCWLRCCYVVVVVVSVLFIVFVNVSVVEIEVAGDTNICFKHIYL